MDPVVRRLLLCFAASIGFCFQAAGELQRVPNTSLQMPQVLPFFGYTATNAFGNLTFSKPVAIASPPGETNRLFIAEQAGRIAVITNLANPTRTVFLDISGEITSGSSDEEGLLGLVFHPGFATNRYFYIFYTGYATTAGHSGRHDILSRFEVSLANSNQADPASETFVIAQYDEAGNHNGGDLHFGPDGYLYVSLGDEGGANDSLNNSQTITKDFFSAILRIDVDKRPGSLTPNNHASSTSEYKVPADNPFVGATSFNGQTVNPNQVRTEFWAVGLRNPWRFTFDPDTGVMYCGDVGQDAWEELDIIQKGGNYGWAYREGMHPGPRNPPSGFTSIDPVFEYGHGTGTNQGYSIIGGVISHSPTVSQLDGAYIFADNVSGNIWATRYDGINASPPERLFGEPGIASFGIDPRNNDILMANQNFSTIRRLIYSTNFNGPPLPATLAETGAFADLSTLVPNPGIVPYDINVPFWSDNAIKTRWFSVPDTNQFIDFNPDSNWSFPTGTVWIKHFELELTNGMASSRKRLETRLLVRSADGIYGVTYRWGNSLTNASLVPEQGMDESFVLDDGGGILSTQVWHYPGRAECRVCHTGEAGLALGFNTAQMNRDYDYSGTITNQIVALNAANYFTTNVTQAHTFRALAPAGSDAVSLEYRVRSYLAANCAQCHTPNGTAQALWDARITTQTDDAGIIDGPLENDLGDPDNRVIAPGSLSQSMILKRISMRGAGQMPPLASTVVDTQAVALVSAWITNGLASYQSFADWQTEYFGSPEAPGAGPDEDPDGDGAVNYLEYLIGTYPQKPTSTWGIAIQRAGTNAQIKIKQPANRAVEVQYTRDLASPNWTMLDVPGNEPFFPITNRAVLVNDLLTSSNAFYRVRVFPP